MTNRNLAGLNVTLNVRSLNTYVTALAVSQKELRDSIDRHIAAGEECEHLIEAHQMLDGLLAQLRRNL